MPPTELPSRRRPVYRSREYKRNAARTGSDITEKKRRVNARRMNGLTERKGEKAEYEREQTEKRAIKTEEDRGTEAERNMEYREVKRKGGPAVVSVFHHRVRIG